MAKVIGIIGCRIRDSKEDFDAVYNEFSKYYDDGDIICSGGCSKGGDRFAELIAYRMNLTIENKGLIIHYPKIKQKCNKFEYANACYKRNTLIARDSDILIACVNPKREGGTEDTIKKFLRFNKEPENLLIV